MSKYGGRRFGLVLGCALTYTALLINGYIDPITFRDLQVLTVGAYIAGNGAQKYAEIRHGSGNIN